MRILQVTPYYYPELKFGGPPQKIHTLGRGLVTLGNEVSVLTVHSEQPKSSQASVLDGIEVQYLPWVGKGTWQIPLDLGLIREAVRQSDVVHCYGLYNLLAPSTAFMARRLGCPYLLEPLGMYVPRGHNVRLKKIYHQLFTASLIRGAACVIATSDAEMTDLSAVVGDRRLVLRRNGIDLTPFKALPSGAAFRALYNIEAHERIVVYIGRISPIKNLEQLVLAFREAALPHTRLILIGPMLEPRYAKTLRRLIEEVNLTEQVLLVGPLYDEAKLSALAAADLFVLPSLYESFGNAAAEAVAAGLPVLLTEGCGIAPLIHGRAGLAVPTDVTSLAKGLQIMIEDSVQRALLTAQRDKVLEELSWDGPVTHMEALYRSVVEASGS